MNSGLSSIEAASRLASVGPNALPERAPLPLWRRFLRQFDSPLIYLLLFALAFDLGLWIFEGAHGWPVEASAIALILLFNAALGVYQEQRSEEALARLRDLSGALAWAMRDGALTRVPATSLVPGDVVRLEAGDRVPADGTLTQASGVMLDESVLTGESVPVEKGDGHDVLSGTLLVRGRTSVEVTRTGSASAMGRLATMLGDITSSKTPLERRLDVMGRQIAIWVLVLAATLGLFRIAIEGLERAPEMVLFAISLAVAAVPEGLPAVLTVALALGVERMARHKAIVRRLAAVESLGSVTVIATDKTGTLTENRMDVARLDVVDQPRALVALVLANDADLTSSAGDPLDLGLLRYAAAHGIDVAHRRAESPRTSERPFDSQWKFTRVSVQEGERQISYVKGAPEVILERSALADADRDAWAAKANDYASEGFRVIGMAWGADAAEESLTWLGVALLWDPPRAEVPAAVATAHHAGIRVLMITGDHPATALTIAQQIGIHGDRVLTGTDLDTAAGALAGMLDEVNVFARVRPEQKLQLVEALQTRGDIVAMTGDGVNDAPALKRSDVGVAMGQRGSDVSREVADLVLLDDNFATIVRAVEEGRGIYENVQTFLRFLFSTNLSEVVLITLGTLLAVAIDLRDTGGQLMIPLTAVQILWINLISDGIPALALAFDRRTGLMDQPPRPPQAPLLDRPSIRFIIYAGGLKALLALAMLAVLPRAGYDLDIARAATFHFMAIGQLLLVYPARLTRTTPTPNAYLHLAIAGGVLVQFAAATIPAASRLLGGVALPLELWPGVLGAAGVAWLLAQACAWYVWNATDRRPQP